MLNLFGEFLALEETVEEGDYVAVYLRISVSGLYNEVTSKEKDTYVVAPEAAVGSELGIALGKERVADT